MSVSSVGSGTSSGSGLTGVLPTNVGPISFTGLASGLNANTIIKQLTQISQQQEVPYQNRITSLNAQNTELAKIQNLLTQLQGSLDPLSDPTTFQSYTATTGNSAVVTATPISGTGSVAGTYTIVNTTVGTATQVLGSSTFGHVMNDTIAGTPSIGVPLVDSYAQITPSNGTNGTGTVTVDGVSVSYDVNSQSLSTILNNIQTQVRAATGDATFTASYNAGTDKVTFSSTTQPITLGAAGDTGNLLQVLKLDIAPITNTASSGTATSAYGIGGVNQYRNFASNNPAGDATNANFQTAVTAGTFTINGVSFTVNPSTQALSDIITQINSSSAGVTAAFDQETGRITLSNKNAGAQSIVIGAASDTSNFLTAAGLTSAAGATTNVGTQAVVTYLDPSGISHTVYSNSNQITTAIPGVTLGIVSSATSANIPITVSQSPSNAETALNSFVTAYNNLLNELNNAVAAPVVTKTSSNAIGGAYQSLGGGVLYGVSQVEDLRNQLINFVSSQEQTGSNQYNSLSSVGLQLDSSFTVLSGASTGASVSGAQNVSSTSGITTQTLQGTDGAFQPLDTTTFEAAFAADPNSVSNLFVGAKSFVSQLGTYLTSTTGIATTLASGLAGTPPSTSLISGIEQQNTNIASYAQNQITQIQQQLTSQANQLNTQFAAAEEEISALQSQQAYISQLGGSSSASSSSTSLLGG